MLPKSYNRNLANKICIMDWDLSWISSRISSQVSECAHKFPSSWILCHRKHSIFCLTRIIHIYVARVKPRVRGAIQRSVVTSSYIISFNSRNILFRFLIGCELNRNARDSAWYRKRAIGGDSDNFYNMIWESFWRYFKLNMAIFNLD